MCNQKVIYFYQYIGTWRGEYIEYRLPAFDDEVHYSFLCEEGGSIGAEGCMWCADYGQATACPDKRFSRKGRRKRKQ
jgi:hypothetical protein